MIAIVGPTASGKSALAMELARRHQGEIIAADSRTVYRGMDIGTAKPSPADQKEIPHHLLDVIDPTDSFSAAEFQRSANQAIIEIEARNHLPLLVGGTGLYVDAVLYDFAFPAEGANQDDARRAELAGLGLAELQARTEALGIELNDSDQQNPRRLIRAIETAGVPRARQPLRPHTLVLGMIVERRQLEARIRARIDEMLDNGFLEEVRGLGRRYGWEAEAMSGIGYRAFGRHLQGELTLDQATEEFVRGDMRLAKRQMTWFKRNPDIIWVASQDEGVERAEAWMGKAV